MTTKTQPDYDAPWPEWTAFHGFRLGDEIDSEEFVGSWIETDGASCTACGEAPIGTRLLTDPDDCSVHQVWKLAFVGPDGPVCEDCMITIDNKEHEECARQQL